MRQTFFFTLANMHPLWVLLPAALMLQGNLKDAMFATSQLNQLITFPNLASLFFIQVNNHLEQVHDFAIFFFQILAFPSPFCYSKMHLETQPSTHSVFAAATKAENTAEEAIRARAQHCCAHIPIVCFPVCCRRWRDSQLISRVVLLYGFKACLLLVAMPWLSYLRTSPLVWRERIGCMSRPPSMRPSICPSSSRENFTLLWKWCKLLKSFL